ncbi:hypothetical protein IJH19_02525 [Candidatus Saccharibacteria bacterium]|nr:hypothetical protein [Candidatus Saccharibacteria bacterium]
MTNSNELITKEKMGSLLGRALSKVEDKNYSTYFNIAQERLEDLLCVELKAPLQPGLELLLARCFATIGQEQEQVKRSGIKSKKIEDYSVSYDESITSPMEAFVKQNDAALEKYSECQAGIRHGKVCNGNGIRSIYLR